MPFCWRGNCGGSEVSGRTRTKVRRAGDGGNSRIVENAGKNRAPVLDTPESPDVPGKGQDRSCAWFFLARPHRVYSREERDAEGTEGTTQPPQAPESGGRSSAGASAPSARPAGAAGSGGLPPTRKPARTRDRRDREREAVPSRFAVEADACGALSCRETDALLKVETDEGQRVLCPDHAPGWVRR